MNCRLINLKKCLYIPMRKSLSFWGNVVLGPPDPIYGLTEAYKACKNPKKVNLAIGTYQDDNGKPYVLRCVRKAEKLLNEMRLTKDYTPTSGTKLYRSLCLELALGKDSKQLQNGLFACAQAVSRTGALRVAFDFIKMFYEGQKVVYLPNPTWGNHKNMITEVGLTWQQYKYYDYKSCDFDFKSMAEDIAKMPERAVLLLQSCAHNPTGQDPSRSQWEELSDSVKKKKFLVVFDMSYHGFASGHFEVDAYSVRRFIEDGNMCIVIQSFSKNMGLYGERPGAVIVTTESKDETERVQSQINSIIQDLYYYPPLHGARIVEKILGDSGLKSEWKLEFKLMADRLISIRRTLKTKLQKEGSIRNWDHIVKQNGMFCLTGLSKAQVKKLTKEHSIFLSQSGRISIGGLNTKNVDYVAHAIHLVTRYIK